MRIVAGTTTGQLKAVAAAYIGVCPSCSLAHRERKPAEDAARAADLTCESFFNVDKLAAVLMVQSAVAAVTSADASGSLSGEKKDAEKAVEAEIEVDEEVLLVARCTGSVDIWLPRTGTVFRTIQVFNRGSVGAPDLVPADLEFVGLDMLDKHTLLAASASGEVVAVDIRNTGPDGAGPHLIRTLNIAANVCRLRCAPQNRNIAVYGGRQVDLALLDFNKPIDQADARRSKGNALFNFKSTRATWDPETFNNTHVWFARNLPDDHLDLAVPIHFTDIQFIGTSCCQIAACSAYRNIRVYDTRISRRPIKIIDVGKSPLRTISYIPNSNNHVVVGDNLGFITRVALTKGEVVIKYTGNSGSLRQVLVSSDGKYLVAAGLDRRIRMWELSTAQLRGKWFAKQLLTCISLLNQDTPPLGSAAETAQTRDRKRKLDQLSNPRKPKEINYKRATM